VSSPARFGVPKPAAGEISRCPLFHDPAEYAVDQAARVLRGVPLGQRDGLVDRDLERYFAPIELEERKAKDIALERAEPVGCPVVGGFRDAAVEACLDPLGPAFAEARKPVVLRRPRKVLPLHPRRRRQARTLEA
jgi:hypothetical protein